MRTLTSFTATMLLTHSFAATASAQITNPLPAPVDKRGIMVEILKDVAFRVVPIDKRDARQMIHEIKGYPVLEGFRGSDPADVAKLQELLLKVSAFVESHPEVAELDLNPVFAYKDGAIAVDARVVLK